MGDLLEHFLSEECNDHVSGVLRAELRSRSQGSRYFTFNAFNVWVDADTQLVTVEDELDPDATESVPIDEFLARLG